MVDIYMCAHALKRTALGCASLVRVINHYTVISVRVAMRHESNLKVTNTTEETKLNYPDTLINISPPRLHTETHCVVEAGGCARAPQIR